MQESSSEGSLDGEIKKIQIDLASYYPLPNEADMLPVVRLLQSSNVY